MKNNILKNGCKWKLKLSVIGGNPSDDTSIQEFDSDIALDTVIHNYVQNNFKSLKTLNLKLFNASLKSQKDLTEEKLKTLESKVKEKQVVWDEKPDPYDPEDRVYKSKVPGTLGFSSAIKYLTDAKGNPCEAEFNIASWESMIDDELRIGYVDSKHTEISKWVDVDADGKPITISDPEKRKKIIAAIEDGWQALRDEGEEIHSIYEFIMKHDDKVPTQIAESNLSPEAFKECVEQAKAFKEEIRRECGEKCTFFPEYTVVCENIPTEIRERLSKGTKENITGLLGRIDLLVVDGSGNLRIYDYKVSRKAVGTWNNMVNLTAKIAAEWDSNKKRHCAFQQAFYRAMFESLGFTVLSDNIVPIQTILEYKENDSSLGVGKNAPIQPSKVSSMKRRSQDLQRNRGTENTYREAAKLAISMPIIGTSRNAEAADTAIQHFMPISTKEEERQQKKHDIGQLKKISNIYQKLDVTHEQYKNGKRFGVKDFSKGKTFYYETEQQAEEALERYAAASAARAQDDNVSLHNELVRVFSQRGQVDVIADTVGTLDTKFSELANVFVNGQFRRYIEDHWQYISSYEAAANGFFLFKKDNKIELVVTDNEHLLRNTRKLSEGTSLLGNFKRDRDNDKTKTPLATYGHIGCIRGAAFLASLQDSDMLKNAKIVEIRTVNLNAGQSDSLLLTKIFEVYNELTRLAPESGAVKFQSKHSFSTDRALIESAMSRLRTFKGITSEIDYSDYDGTIAWIEKMQRELIKMDPSLANYSSLAADDVSKTRTALQDAFAYLTEARLYLKGYTVEAESDYSDWAASKGIALNGLRISSIQYSPSANIRTLGMIIDKYANNVRQRVVENGTQFMIAMGAFYNEHGYGRSKFESWFADKKTLTLKRPDSHDFDGDPTARAALTAFLEGIWRIKNPNGTDAQLELAKETDEYYHLPLTACNSVVRMTKELGFRTMFKRKIAEYKQLSKDVFAKDDEDTAMQHYLSANQLYNKFENQEARRDELLQEYQVGYFETDIEMVFNEVLVAYSKQQVGKQMLPDVAGLKLLLRHKDAVGAYKMNEDEMEMTKIRKAFDDIVTSKIFGQSIVKDENLKSLMRWLNVVRGVLTDMTLSLNITSFLRESLQGIWNGIARAHVELLPGVNSKTYVKALTTFIKECPKNYSNVSMIQQMNALYGMANMGLDQLARQRRRNWTDPHHWGKNTLFLTATAPDLMHRMSILMAKMMGDGCWDAHSLNEKGILVYDYNKDERFKDYRERNTRSKDYLKQEALYKKMREEFIRDGLMKEEDIALPQAYTQTEAAGIKNYADLLYGHYDPESKSLLCESFLGSYLLQYKTWVTSKMEQWTMEEGSYETKQLKQQFDKDGNELYVMYGFTDDNGEEIPFKDIITKNEYEALSEEEKQMCDLYFEYEGIPMQGMFNGMGEFAKSLKDLAAGDPETFKKLWNDPKSRAILKLGLMDSLLALLMGFFVNAIFGTFSESEQPLNIKEVRQNIAESGNSLEYLAYNVLMGSLQDSQPWQIVGNFTAAAKGEIPMITGLERLTRTSISVFAGKSNVEYWATRNFGVLRPFNGWAKTLNEQQQKLKREAL